MENDPRYAIPRFANAPRFPSGGFPILHERCAQQIIRFLNRAKAAYLLLAGMIDQQDLQ